MSFLDIRFFDLLDIALVALVLYQLYMLTKGTVAINIFAGIVGIYLVWLMVKAVNMQLLSSILGQVMGVGVIALIIVFQQEIRSFLLLLGSRYFSNTTLSIEQIFSMFIKQEQSHLKIASLVKACKTMSKSNTGALIVIQRESDLSAIAKTGDILDSLYSSRVVESVFFKNSPMHDGGMVVINDKIHAARCVLPVSQNAELPKHMGLRHKAAVGISENTDAVVLVVSEETGAVSLVLFGKIQYNISTLELRAKLEELFSKPKKTEQQ